MHLLSRMVRPGSPVVEHVSIWVRRLGRPAAERSKQQAIERNDSVRARLALGFEADYPVWPNDRRVGGPGLQIQAIASL